MIGRAEAPARLGPPSPSRPGGHPEDRAIDLNAIVAPYVGAALVGLALAAVALLLLTLILARRVGRLGRRLDDLTRGEDGPSLDDVLARHLDRMDAVGRDVEGLSARAGVLEALGRRSIQRVGLVRFNPFEDTGGNQSFALALTDAGGDGFVLSSLHSRTGTRVYAKSITGGRSDGALSEEEAEALRMALASATVRPGASPGGRERATGPV